MSSGDSGDSGGDIGSSASAASDSSTATIAIEAAPDSAGGVAASIPEAQRIGQQDALSSTASPETAAIGMGWRDTSLSQPPTEAAFIGDYAWQNQPNYDALPAPERVEAALEADKPGLSGSSRPHSEVYTMFNPALGQVYVGLVKDAPGARTAQQSLILDYESRVAHGMTPDTGWGLPVLDLSTLDQDEATGRAQMLLNYYRDQGMLAQMRTPAGGTSPEQNFVQPHWQRPEIARGAPGWEPVTAPVHEYIEPPEFSRLGERTVVRDRQGYTYETYTMYNERTGEVYAGKTSGFAGPLENVAARYKEHVASGKTPERGWQPAVLDRTSANERAIDGREVEVQYENQRLGIAPPADKYHRGASPSRAPELIDVAQQEFGPVPAGGVHHPWNWW